MKKCKVFCIAFTLITVFVMLMSLSACKPKEKDVKLILSHCYNQNENPHITDYFDVESKLNLAVKIDSVAELIAFCNEKQLSVFDENSAAFNDGVSKKLREFDNDFFIDSSIALILRFKETSDNYVYSSAQIDNGVMNVNFITATGATATKITTQITILEFNKTAANTITSIKINYNKEKPDKNYDVKIYEDKSLYLREGNYSTIINNISELNDLCDEETSPIFDKNNPYISIEDYKSVKILRDYDEEFFQNKSLVVLFRFRASSGHFYKLNNLQINGNTINILLVRILPKEPVFYPDDVITCLYIIEMDKATSANITQINVEELEI